MLIRIPDTMNGEQVERLFNFLKLEGYQPHFKGCGDGTIMIWCDLVNDEINLGIDWLK